MIMIQSTIRGILPRRRREWFFVSVGRVLNFISTLSSGTVSRKFGAPPDSPYPFSNK
jgi:hypothetical protein